MGKEKASVIPMHLHPRYQNHHRVNELKIALLAQTLAFTQLVLDNATVTYGASPQVEKILAQACCLLEEIQDRIMLELL